MSRENVEDVEPESGQIQDAEKTLGDSAILADRSIRNHMFSASAIGLVPVPFVDVAAITAVQAALVRRLAIIYGTTYSEQAVRNTIGALVGGVIGHNAGVMTAISLARFVPFGGLFSLASLSAIAGGTTYALGRVFQRHFENGGSVSDIVIDNVQGFFGEQFEQGKKIVAKMGRGQTQSA